ncbi:uncharacterized protein LOC133664695 [Entelurus aequoreus]|uniref:uncharacterized protein LOC133663820 n=1 Tax=Entelurus aequoreus TaxID=161455 RepID=UPI002B1D3179|nr:uncharacterized protein LOC133663820 [Entelurus aequoreus]XP_061925518.1 uncharacterized protein LOC133664695 [Entelurus aequoreus]
MAASAILLLLFALLGFGSAEDFYGDSVSFVHPHKDPDGYFKVAFHHRQNGRNHCDYPSSYTCMECTSFDNSSVMQTDQDNSGQDRWCQSEGHTMAKVSLDASYISLSNAGCCWASNNDAKTNWTGHAHLDLSTRSDTKDFNNCPVTTTVSSLRVPQNCFSEIHLLAYDPDGDNVKCRLVADVAVHANITLNTSTCTLDKTGEVSAGVYVFELMLDDFPTKNLNLSYANGTSTYWESSNENSPPLCSLKLQFLLEILSPLPVCKLGHVLPKYLYPTPKHGDVLHATVGHKFMLHAEAQAHHATITDFQVSVPYDMTKEFSDDQHGKAGLKLTWTPQHSDVDRVAPVCFTAETNESQSEMRCVAVVVSEPTPFHGKTDVTCMADKMMVAIERSTLPDVDVNYISLMDPSCLVTHNDTHIMGSMMFGNCGTTFEESDNYIFFKNQIQTLRKPDQVVIRRKSVKISFSCQFPKTASISSSYNVQKSNYVFSDSELDSFSYSFDVYTDGNFTAKVQPNAYPVEVEFLQKIFLGIKADSELANVSFFVESCKATPDDNPDNAIFYDLIKEGCLKDESLKVQAVDSMTFHMEVEAFRFDGSNDQVYITCTVLICDTNNPFSRCAMGCHNEAFRRRRRSVGVQSSIQSLMQGPFQFVYEALPIATVNHEDVMMKVADAEEMKAAERVKIAEIENNPLMKKSDMLLPVSSETQGHMAIKEMLSSNISTGLFAAACSLSVVVLAAVVAYYNRKSKEDDQKPLLRGY